MNEPITTKARMMALFLAGRFGNVNPHWTDLHSWLGSDCGYRNPRCRRWGVRHMTIPGFPGTKLNVPREDVVSLVRGPFASRDYAISPMIGQFGRRVLWEGDVCRDPHGPGLVACGNVNPADGSWREHMKHPREWTGSAASVLLRHVLNENSYDDLLELLDDYPDHVVELSALDGCYGSVPHRNAVVWEVRRY